MYIYGIRLMSLLSNTNRSSIFWMALNELYCLFCSHSITIYIIKFHLWYVFFNFICSIFWWNACHGVLPHFRLASKVHFNPLDIYLRLFLLKPFQWISGCQCACSSFQQLFFILRLDPLIISFSFNWPKPFWLLKFLSLILKTFYSDTL